ncbi:hypothetical protein MNBD_NITROSPIRAE01-2109 [hydrothermal vent metagenome]|uniref:OsmC/Ohr family protein n=1 Tax=hydrothermal vent metagenome TaxID=652676 RepID=A0A3B1CU41_9ZZZZ
MGYEVDYFHARIEWLESDEGTTLDYGAYSRSHRMKCPEKTEIVMSAAPQYKGDASFHNPEELFTASIASCQMLTYLALAAFSQVEVLAYTDDAEGILKVDSRKKRWLTQVILRPKILITKESDREKALSLVERAHKQCFIASSVNTEIINKPEILIA